jgi:hypothetical protein
MSIVLGGVLFQNGIEAHSTSIETAVGGGANVGLIEALPDAQRVVRKIAYAESLRDMWILYTCTAGLGLLASIFIGKQPLPELQPMDPETRPHSDLELQAGKPN